MRKLIIIVAAVFILLPSALSGALAAEFRGPLLTVSGLVKQPLRLTMADLERLSQVRVRYNDIKSDGAFHGAFWLRGAPLRDILDLAQIGKDAPGFNKLVDLAVVVRNAQGSQVTVSWGEIFHRNPGEAILALSSTPVRPKKDCKACHEPDVYEDLIKQLDRKLGLPKLVLTNDFASNRGLEDVVSLRVVEPVKVPQGPRPKTLHSPTLSVVGSDGKEHKLDKLPALHRRTIVANQVGEGKGFHGRPRFSGVALADLLGHFKITGDNQSAVVVSAPDGYTSLVSWGELFMGPLGQRIIVADRMDGKPMKENGRFALILPDDLWADRWVKATAKIQAVRLKKQPRLMVIGMGCGDSDLLTLQALDALSQADVLVAPKDIQKRFAPFLAGKPVIFDHMAATHKKPLKKQMEAHKDADSRHMDQGQAQSSVDLIKAQLAQGKSVAVLDWGDPMVYGSWRWLKDAFPLDHIRFVSGLSAFNAGSAAIGRDIACNGAMAITDPYTLLKAPGLLKSLAAKGATLAVFMAMPKFAQVLEAVRAAYPPDTPTAVVYRAGMKNQQVAKSRLDQVLKVNPKDRDRWLGVVYVGPCLQ
ncbi:MAG: hypothetical protein KJ720_05625 [Proteobacteria bacterium]|nr:hypothetical protein [Pseudomonadota bacterium]MBU1449499.1 hypothetical protein [Pseudomonadota bacterium]MBU2467638.1 hypothetical protein [Pseudomonadota bacterium]MBU2516193.1 hypothetical protein [Pseudomonadota bacterium]